MSERKVEEGERRRSGWMKDGGSVCEYQWVCLRSCCMSVCGDTTKVERREGCGEYPSSMGCVVKRQCFLFKPVTNNYS